MNAKSPMSTDRKSTHPETQAIHADRSADDDDAALAPSIPYSATFRARDAQQFAEMAMQPRHPAYYTRYGNPLHARVARLLAELEGTETALLTASGMGAISTTVLALVAAGDHVVAQTRHYMSTAKLFAEVLPRFGVQATLVEQTDPAAIEAALKPNTRLVMLESPVNPTMQLTDMAAVAELARARGITTIADNTFASPINQQPHVLGIDIVVHSATKVLGGHHDITAGVICCSQKQADDIWRMHITLGSVLSPMDAWLLPRGLRTLPLRVARINTSALALAQWLQAQPQVKQVFHPGLSSHPQHALAQRQMKGFGGVLAFEIDADYAATARFVASLKLATQAVSLGGVETLVVHAAAMWSGVLAPDKMAAAGIAPNLVRLSLGLEHVDDLIADVEQALAAL
jgi:cystathionine gamma-lyase